MRRYLLFFALVVLALLFSDNQSTGYIPITAPEQKIFWSNSPLSLDSQAKSMVAEAGVLGEAFINLNPEQKALLKAASADEDLQELIDFAPDLINYEQVFKRYVAGSLDPGNYAENFHRDGLVKEGEVVTETFSHSSINIPFPEPDSTSTNTLSPFPRRDHPNIILIISDDQSYESLGRMPYVGSLANYWSHYTNAFNNVSLCCPSRVAMLTGQFSHHNRVDDNLKAGLFNTQGTTW